MKKILGKWYNLAEDTEINIEWNKTIKSVVENELKKGKIRVIKVDKDNNEIRIPNVEFNVLDANGKVLETIKTDENGIAETSKFAIRDYDKLFLKEVKTDRWYVLNDKQIGLTLKENDVVEVQVENELKKGQIRVIKIDKDNNEVKLKGVEFKVYDESGNVVDTLITDENGEAVSKRLPINQKFKVKESKSLEDYVLNEEVKTVTLTQDQITDITFTNELKKGQIKVIKVDMYNNEIKLKGVEFEVIDESGNVVDTLITDENGECVSKELRIDKKYQIKEKRTLEKYDLNEEVKTVTLTQNQITDITFENELKKGKIRVIKVDLDNNEVKLKGVEFEVLDEEGKVVDTLITNENGEAVSKELKVNQQYVLKEKRTLENYVLNEETKTVTLKPAEITEITFENEKIKGYIQVTKTSAEDNELSELPKGSPLANVVFEIYNSEDKLVDTITTDENGKAVTKELLKGCYKIKEKASVKYYLLNTNTYNAEIVNDQEIVNVDINKENVEIDVEIQKNGFIETQSKDSIFYNFKNIKNKSNVPLDNFTWRDTLPTQALRVDKIYTGTWNEDLEYSVWYKTNKNDYKMLVDGLSTQVNNEVSFKDIELQEDEFITEYEFRFGTVKVGFSEIESPILYCDMLDDLGNGFVFTNYTKVFGNYEDKYIEDNDEWKTITYFKEIKVTQKLPRTGC